MSYHGRGGGARYGPDRPDPRSGASAPPPEPRPPLPTPAEVLRDLDNLGAVARNGRFGTDGKPINVMVNCFQADVSSVKQILTHFDVSYEKILPEPPSGGRGRGRGRGRGGRGGRGRGGRGQAQEERPIPLGICTKLIRQIESRYARDFNNAKIAHDGRKNAYTAVSPEWSNREFEASWEDVRYKVIFKVANQVNMGDLTNYMNGVLDKIPQECITVLDIVLRTSPLREWVYTGRAFGIPPSQDQLENCRIGDGCEAWICYYQAFRPNENGMFLTFDVMYSAFYAEQSLYDFTVDVFSGAGRVQEEGGQSAFQRPFGEQELYRLKMELQGIRCVKNYGPEEERMKKFTVRSITKEPASQVEYESAEASRRMTIQEYFESIGEALVHPHMPCVKVPQGKNASVYIPLEKCQIDHGQRRTKPMNSEMKERLSKIAIQAPLSRMGRIGDVLGDVNASTQEYLNAFGVKVDLQKLSIPARVIEPPVVQMGDGSRVEVGKNEMNDFSWSMNGRKLYQTGKELKSWGVLVLADVVKYDVQKFVAAVTLILREMGLEVDKPAYKFGHTPILQKGMIDLFDSINNNPDTPPCQLIMVIKTDASTRDYNRIKNVGDTYFGIPTQCVVASHARSPTKLYCQNLALKINAKLGGVTSRIPGDHFVPLGNRFMVVGVTISHSSGRAVVGSTPSVVSMVGSLDKRCGRYAGCWRMQDAATPGIVEFGDMLEQQLRNFFEREDFFPDNILIYRNGVADGQFPDVVRSEVNAARASARKVGSEKGEDYNPKITLVVMQRGHHTKFIPVDEGPKDASDNCIPGTVIDSKVSHPRNFDFFLISHNGIQGVSRPQRYTVLVDDMKFTPDQIQGLTYHLCYTFTRCTRSVSIVPALYYADLLAVRVRAFQEARSPPRLELATGQPIIRKDASLPKEFAEGDPLMHKNLTNRFFYV